jgi:hypothetical protein
VSKTKLEGLFVDELALLQPTPGYMRPVKDRVLYVWQQLTSEVKERAAETGRRATAIQQKLDRLDEAYLFAQTIDLKSYERQRDKLREELTLAQIDRHPSPSKNSTYRASWRSQSAFYRARRICGCRLL